jgi:tetratricopeptide (TPR) repeat protein
MLAPLGDAGRTLLKFAALLPPERIPRPWLKDLTARHHPELLEATLPSPWTRLRRQVQGLRFLTGSIEDHAARMHRLIAAHLRRDGNGDLDAELRDYLAERAYEFDKQEAAPADGELDGLLEAIPHLLNARLDQCIAADGMFLSNKVLAYRNVPGANALLKSTGAVIQALADADPTSAAKQRDLPVSYERLGGVSVAAGDLKAARGYFEGGLRIRRLLADADPTSALQQRDLCVSHWKIANLLEQQGQPAEALTHWQKAHDILQGMVTRGLHVSPADRAFLEPMRQALGK